MKNSTSKQRQHYEKLFLNSTEAEAGCKEVKKQVLSEVGRYWMRVEFRQV